MKTRVWKKDGGWLARSVLECGGPPPLSEPSANRARPQSARGLAHSKTLRGFAASVAILALAGVAQAQSYSVDWSKIAGGGGTSTGGAYAVSGTTGQQGGGGEPRLSACHGRVPDLD